MVQLVSLMFLACILQIQAHTSQLMDRSVCRNLNVGHERSRDVKVPEVSIKLVSLLGEQRDCYVPNTAYNVTIQTPGESIRGLLILQDHAKALGTFPYLQKNERLMSGLVKGFCPPSVAHSVSHKCWGRCDLGSKLSLPYFSPADRNNTVEFRYSIVYKEGEFLEDKKVEFPACPPEYVCDIKDLKLNDTTRADLKVNRYCPRNPRYRSDENRTITENGTSYTCTVDGDKVKKKNCSTGCTHTGRAMCCRVEINRVKPRNFTCVPNKHSGDNVTRVFNVVAQKKCECFFCSDVCPVQDFLDRVVTESDDNNLTEITEDGKDDNAIDSNSVTLEDQNSVE